eukprot:271478_1
MAAEDEQKSLLNSHDLKGVAEYIKSTNCKKIAILAGAGISVSAGIKDFRSADGLYNTLNLNNFPTLSDKQKSKIKEHPKYILSVPIFKTNPEVFYECKRDMILSFDSDKYLPTLTHWFFRLLYNKKLLKRFYSQNVDGLDIQTGIPSNDILINVHGINGKAVCFACNKPYDWNKFKQLIKDKSYLKAPITCDKCNGDSKTPNFIKPNIVLMGGNLPQKYLDLEQADDLNDIDLLIVAGTSLKVQPVCMMIDDVNKNKCVRLLINKEKLESGFKFQDQSKNDVCYIGKCDDGFRRLAVLLDWDNELTQLIFKQKTNSNDSNNIIFEEKVSDINVSELVKQNIWLTSDIVKMKWKKYFGDLQHAVLPVIHVKNPMQSGTNFMDCVERNISLILKYKFNGCFVINHGFRPNLLVPIICKIKEKYGGKLWLGANFLGCIGDEFDFMKKNNLLNVLDGLWIDDGGIYYGKDKNIMDKGGVIRLKKYKKYKWNGLYFGGIDFKYKKQINKNEYDNVSMYIEKCKNLSQFVSLGGYMDCICTTGKGTGKAADLDKMKAFKDGCCKNGSKLSIASGVTPENVKSYLPFVDAILVATGISQDFYNFSDLKMKQMRSVIDNYYQQK